MLHRKPVTYALLVVLLLLVSGLGAYSVNAQTQNPPAPAQPATESPQPFQPEQMMGAMAGMLDQMDGLLAATDHAVHLQMAPAMIKILEGMQELSQPLTEQIHGQNGPAHDAQMQQMGERRARMQALTERLHGMAGHGAAQVPAAPAGESAQPAPAAPTAAQMQMGQQMQMMGMMMQMMGMMQSRMAGEMMQPGMREGKGAMGDEMQMAPMMGMMGQMMEKMGEGTMGKGMMGGGGMGQMGAGAPVTGTATAASPASAPGGAVGQSVEGGGVTVKVTPANLKDSDADTLDFTVSLDTHTVELNYDLVQLAVLTDNLGNEYSPASWTPEQSDGHHVGGLLSFGDRVTILEEGVTELTLTVKDVAGIAERFFVWSINQ